MPSTELKIVAIGAGSHEFGRGAVTEVFNTPEFGERGCTLALVDLDEAALDRMLQFARRVKQHHKSKIEVTATTDRRETLPGASYVITSVAIKRYPLWEQDFRIPLAYGFKHPLGENGGPGALFHALRNFELMIPICRDMEQLCPEALLLNFTNPESRIIRAVADLTKIRAVGLCHGTLWARICAAKILERPLEELDIMSGGLNHFFWLTKITDRKTGKDLYPELRRRALAPDCPEMPGLIKKMVEIFGLYTYPSDDHVGEYLAFGAEFAGVKWHYGQELRKVPREETAPEPSRLEQYASGERPLDDEVLRATGELAVPIIRAIELKQRLWADAVNVPNSDGFVESLPHDAVVEAPAWIDGHGIQPQKIGPLPEALAAYCRTQCSIQKLLVQAYRERSRKLLLHALLIDPVVNSIANAEKMLDDMLEIQKEYLPTFA